MMEKYFRVTHSTGVFGEVGGKQIGSIQKARVSAFNMEEAKELVEKHFGTIAINIEEITDPKEIRELEMKIKKKDYILKKEVIG